MFKEIHIYINEAKYCCCRFFNFQQKPVTQSALSTR